MSPLSAATSPNARRCRTESVRLIPGLEFRFAGYPGLHLLALGLRKWITPETPGEFVAACREAAGFTIMAHPLLADYLLPLEVARGIDAIEVWNASYNLRYLPDPRAIELLHRVQRERPEMVGVAGLDQHDSRNDRGTRVVLTHPKAPDPLVELKAGRFHNRGLTMSFGSRVPMGAVRLGLLRTGRRLLDWADRAQDRMAGWRRGAG